MGLVAICTPTFTKYTPAFFFCDSFSVKLLKLTNFVTILVFFRNVTEPCGLYNHPPFDLRNVT